MFSDDEDEIISPMYKPSLKLRQEPYSQSQFSLLNGLITEPYESIEYHTKTQKDSDINNLSDSNSEQDEDGIFNILDSMSFKHNQFPEKPTPPSNEVFFDASSKIFSG